MKVTNIKSQFSKDIKHICLGISASGPTKRWSIKNYINLCEKIDKQIPSKFYIAAGKNDKELINEISKKCNVSLSTKGYFLPEYPVPKEHDFDSFIKKLSSDRLDTLISDLAKDKQDEYESRLNYELDQIKQILCLKNIIF